MVHRIALIGGALAATGILMLAMGAGNLFARSDKAADSVAVSPVSPTPATQVDTVYVKPAPTQRVIHVTRTSPPSAARQTPRVLVVNRPRHHGDDESGHDDGGEQGDD